MVWRTIRLLGVRQNAPSIPRSTWPGIKAGRLTILHNHELLAHIPELCTAETIGYLEAGKGARCGP